MLMAPSSESESSGIGTLCAISSDSSLSLLESWMRDVRGGTGIGPFLFAKGPRGDGEAGPSDEGEGGRVPPMAFRMLAPLAAKVSGEDFRRWTPPSDSVGDTPLPFVSEPPEDLLECKVDDKGTMPALVERVRPVEAKRARVGETGELIALKGEPARGAMLLGETFGEPSRRGAAACEVAW